MKYVVDDERRNLRDTTDLGDGSGVKENLLTTVVTVLDHQRISVAFAITENRWIALPSGVGSDYQNLLVAETSHARRVQFVHSVKPLSHRSPYLNRRGEP